MNILVATGGAAHSTVALRFAVHLAEASHATITVLTVVKRAEEGSQGEAILERARSILDPLIPAARYRTRMRVGHPAEEILAELENHPYELAVVGEKQHHGLLTRFILGSTAQRVIEHAPCPVVLAKGRIGAVKHVLICDSGVAKAPLVERVTEQVPGLLKPASKLTVLHVMSQMGAGPGVDGHQLRADAVELIHEDSPEGRALHYDLRVLSKKGYPCTPKVRHGLVVDEVLAEAREKDYDLVIIGAHRGSGWRRILLDDIAHEIITSLDRPVLVVR